jgi:hypothetical protein
MDFWNIGQPTGFQRDEEESQDFFSLFGAPTEPDFLSGGIAQPITQENRDRTFLDRILAPFEAPQQFLFKLTTGIGEDGFQFKDIRSAIGHGLKYGNPFSNTERIDPEEIRKTFFGEAKEGGSKFWRGASNLAISLLYDPLLLAPIAKGLRLVDKGSAALRNIERITNPAGAGIGEALGFVGRKVGPKLKESAENNAFSARIQRLFLDRFAGLPDELRAAENRLDQGIQKWRTQAHQILKQAERLGGRPAQELMAEALETEAVWLARSGDKSTKAIEEATRFSRRAKDMGVSEDIFWEVYDHSRRLDDQIGEGLVKSGVISGDEFAEMRGTHLRRMFLATDRPQEYIDRLESLVFDTTERFSTQRLMRGLNEIRSELDATIMKTPKGQGQLFDLFGGNKYFRDGERTRFNVQALVTDLDDYLARNSGASADDIFKHIQDEMLEGVQLPETFWKQIGNHISGATTDLNQVRQEWIDKLRTWQLSPGFNWYTVKEKLEVVAKRQDIPEEIRAALGEVLDFGPRIAAEATDAGRLLETRKYLDNIAGVVRDDAGAVISKGGNKLAFTAEEATRMKGLVKLEGKHLGELDGMYVKPGVALHLKQMDGVGNITEPSRKMWQDVGDGIRRVVGMFKIHKVILDPAAQVRNFVGNAVLMDMAGINPFNISRMSKAVVELRDFGKTGNLGKYLQLAEDAGVTMFQHTFAREELQMFARNLGDDLTGDSHKTLGALQRVVKGMQENYGKSVEYMGNLFEFEEKMFKLATFMGKYDELIEPVIRRGGSITPELQKQIASQAGELAERALFNYADIPQIAKFARDYGVIPFVTFPLKSVPYVARTLIENPHRVLKYNRTAEGYNDMMAGSSEDAAREIAGLPPHMRDRLVLRLPFEDDSGRPQFLDLSYFLPWYVIQDFAESLNPARGEDAGPLPRDGMFTPPGNALWDGLRYNRDSLGRPLYTDDMSTAEKFLRTGEFVWQMFAPPDAPGGSRASSIGRAMQAVATNEPEHIDWLAALGKVMSLGGSHDRALPSSGFMPTSQAQVQTGGGMGAVLGGLAGLFAVNTTASDAPQQALNTIAGENRTATEINKDIARVRSNRNLSPREKAVRVRRLIDELIEARKETAETVSRMF